LKIQSERVYQSKATRSPEGKQDEMKNQTITTETAIKQIQEAAKHLSEVRIITAMKIGEVVRQGDIYVERISSIATKVNPVKSRQLAPGTTKGSRHIVDESPSVTLWESKPCLEGKAAFQIGPAIEAKCDFSITHPEHAWIKFVVGKAPQFFQVWFQADFARKERAQD
jgi:hypothetical protein